VRFDLIISSRTRCRRIHTESRFTRVTCARMSFYSPRPAPNRSFKGQPTVSSTRIVPPQCGQRPGWAPGVALSVARPHAMQQARKRIRAARRCAARSSADASTADSVGVGGVRRVTTTPHTGRLGR
jgi:hypothetical protein